MKKILDHWFGWLCLIVLLRMGASVFEKPRVSPREISIQLLLQTAINNKDEQIRSNTLEALKKNALTSRQNRELIVSLLRENKKDSYAQKALEEIQNDPIYIIEQAVVDIEPSLLFYIEPLCDVIPLCFAICLLILTPLFLWRFIGIRALHKIFGKQGTYLLLPINILLWSFVVYSRYTNGPVIITQLALAIISGIVFALLVKSHMLSMLLEATPKYVRLICLLFTALLVVSLLPHFVSMLEQQKVQKISEEQLAEALAEVRQKQLAQAIPSLLRLLNSNHYSSTTNCQMIDLMGELGDETLLVPLGNYLHSPQPEIRSATIKAISSILTTSQREKPTGS